MEHRSILSYAPTFQIARQYCFQLSPPHTHTHTPSLFLYLPNNLGPKTFVCYRKCMILDQGTKCEVLGEENHGFQLMEIQQICLGGTLPTYLPQLNTISLLPLLPEMPSLSFIPITSEPFQAQCKSFRPSSNSCLPGHYQSCSLQYYLSYKIFKSYRFLSGCKGKYYYWVG